MHVDSTRELQPAVAAELGADGRLLLRPGSRRRGVRDRPFRALRRLRRRVHLQRAASGAWTGPAAGALPLQGPAMTALQLCREHRYRWRRAAGPVERFWL